MDGTERTRESQGGERKGKEKKQGRSSRSRMSASFRFDSLTYPVLPFYISFFIFNYLS